MSAGGPAGRARLFRAHHYSHAHAPFYPAGKTQLTKGDVESFLSSQTMHEDPEAILREAFAIFDMCVGVGARVCLVACPFFSLSARTRSRRPWHLLCFFSAPLLHFDSRAALKLARGTVSSPLMLLSTIHSTNSLIVRCLFPPRRLLSQQGRGNGGRVGGAHGHGQPGRAL